jgi:hypothetical protein
MNILIFIVNKNGYKYGLSLNKSHIFSIQNVKIEKLSKWLDLCIVNYILNNDMLIARFIARQILYYYI